MEKRRRIIGDFCELNDEERRMFDNLSSYDLPYTENPVGIFPNMLRFANNFKINGRDYIIPMVTEEASVVAGASYGAGLCYNSDGIRASVLDSKEYSKALGQVQLMNVKDTRRARREIMKNKHSLLEKANRGHKFSKSYDLNVNEFDSDLGKMLIVNLFIDPGDSMGAAVASEMACSVSPEVSRIAKAEYNKGIVSNYSGRLVEAELRVSIDALARKSKTSGKEWSGEDVKQRILWLDRWARNDPKRAVTNNKGIMNGIIAVARATAQDDRAIEAANAVYAYRRGKYQPLSVWSADNDYLHGKLKIIIPCGTVGGEIKSYPMAEFLLKKILKAGSAYQLAEIITSAGTAGNLASLSMNSTIGLEEGHEPHRK